MAQQWTYQSRRSDHSRTEELTLGWEVSGDPISDSYRTDEIPAIDLFDLWFDRHGAENNGLLSIYWSVYPVTEAAPLQAAWAGSPDFLTYWTDPIDLRTGAPLNWLELPVDDKQWSTRGGDKGGFIQEATGWKPSALQPYVYAPALRAAADARQ